MTDATETDDDRAKKQADTAKVRADIEIARATAAQAAAKAQLDNETIQLANDRARQDARNAATDRLATMAKGLVPDLGSVPQNGLSIADGYVFHRKQVEDGLLDGVLKDVASALHGRLPATERVFVVDGATLAESAAEYQTLLVRVAALQAKCTAALLEVPPPAPASGVREAHQDALLSSLDVVGAVVSAVPPAVSAVLALVQVDASVGGSSASVPTAATHARLAMRLLDAGHSSVEVQAYASPLTDSPLLQALDDLRGSLLEVEAAARRIGLLVKALDDDDPGRPVLQTVADRLQVLLAAGAALLTEVTSIASGQTRAPLAELLALEPAVDRRATGPTVLIVPAPVVSVDQVVIRRRILRSRLIVAGYARIDWLLLRKGELVAGGSASATTGFSVKFKGSGPEVAHYPGLASIRVASRTSFPPPAAGGSALAAPEARPPARETGGTGDGSSASADEVATKSAAAR